MSFVEIKPRARKSSWDGCAMSVTKAGKNLKMRILLTHEIMGKLKIDIGGKAECLKGEEDHGGKILIRKGTGFSISKSVGTVGRIDIPNLWAEITAPCFTMQAEYEFLSIGLLVTVPDLKGGQHEK